MLGAVPAAAGVRLDYSQLMLFEVTEGDKLTWAVPPWRQWCAPAEQHPSMAMLAVCLMLYASVR